MKQLIDNIIKSLEAFKDPKRIEMAARSYPTGMKVMGVIVPNVKVVLKELKKQVKNMPASERIELTKQLVQTNIFECQQLAYEFIGNDKQALDELTETDIDELGQNLDNWVSVDYYAGLIVGYAWRVGIVSIDKIKSYLQSDDFWIRRIAVVATVSLNQKARGGKGDPEQTLEICSMAVSDHQEMITKALSWALRELAKVDKDPVIDFIKMHKDKLHKRVLREVTHKLDFGTKT
jgi:3-methyladenine DNA glycosylase AlkD